MRVPYETMLAEFERVLKKYGFSAEPPKFLPRTVWRACSATG